MAAGIPVGALGKIASSSAEEVCGLVTSGGLPMAAGDNVAPAAFLESLLNEDKLHEAVHFLSFALPKREAVWWACLCARESLSDAVPENVVAALDAAEAWVYRPTEENRRAAMARAQATGFDSPGVWAAVAAFWSGGSIAPPELPAVPPAAHLTGVAVAGAVTLASVQFDPAAADQRRARFVRIAINIANGGNGRIEDKS